MDELKKLINEQIMDNSIWFIAETATEAYLQKALRRLHAGIEKYLLQSKDPINDLYLKKEH